jgi:hypothetical protein
VVVFTTDAVVEVFTVMVKVLDTPVASVTVVALIVNLRVTFSAEHYFIVSVVPFDVYHQIIDWVSASQGDVVVPDQNQKPIDEGNDDPED